MSYKPKVLEVAAGGTGLAATTAFQLLVSTAASTIGGLTAGTTGQVLTGVTGAVPAFSATPSVTSITLSGGNALSTYVESTSWTPTIVGGTTAGTTAYATQNGSYVRIGNLVWISVFVAANTATGTGDIRIGNLPFTINGNCFPSGAMYIDAGALAWPVGRTQAVATGSGGNTYCTISCSGTAQASARMQMANTPMSFIFGMTYQI
ncbi:MAG: hypothetical protein V4563_17030 [Pseudomonadota bacterium]